MTMTPNKARARAAAYAADFDREVPDWELCDRLRRSLRMINLSSNEIAEILGVSRATVSTWLNGHNVPRRAALMWWADAADVPLEWLETGQAPAVEPEPDELRARRDSNPQPSDWEPAAVRAARRWGLSCTVAFPQVADNSGLSANRRAGLRRASHLRVVS